MERVAQVFNICTRSLSTFKLRSSTCSQIWDAIWGRTESRLRCLELLHNLSGLHYPLTYTNQYLLLYLYQEQAGWDAWSCSLTGRPALCCLTPALLHCAASPIGPAHWFALRSFSTLVCLLCTLATQPKGALELTYNRPKWNYLVQTSFNLTNAQGQQLVQQYYNYFEHFLTPFNICTS